MSPPTVTRLGDTLTLDFHSEMVHATLDRFRETRGDVSAELTLRTSSPGLNPHLHRSRWSLVSMNQREQLARLLRKRFPVDGIGWSDMVEAIAVIALDHYRTGEPVVMVGRLDRAPGPEFVVEPLLLVKNINLLYGPGDTGKTNTALALALSIQQGVPLLGLPIATASMSALFLDWETNAETVDGIVKRLAAGAGMAPMPELAYRRCVGALADQVEDLRRLIAEHQIGFVVIDSLGGACGGEPESAEVVLRLMNGVRSLGITPLLIDHTPRDGDEPFGSVYKFNASRNIWRTRRQQEVGEDEMEIGLFNTKSNLTRKHRPLGWRVRFNNAAETTTFSRIEPADVEAFRSGLPAREQIRTYLLGAGAATAKAIAEATGLNLNTVRETLKRMEGRHQAMRLPREGERETYWGVPTP